MDGATPHSPTSRAKAILALALALALGVLLAACGSSSDNGGDTTGALPANLTTTPVPDTLTKQEYIARGDQICAAGSFKVFQSAKSQYPSGALTPDQIRSFVPQTIVPVFEEQINQLRALPPPSGDAHTVKAIYDSLQKAVDQLKADPTLYPNSGGIFDEPSRLARAYGFTQCGQR